MKKYKLFTHTDFDGIGCAILALNEINASVEVEYCDYDNVNKKVLEFIDSKTCDVLTYDKVFITDISINEDVADTIDLCFNNFILLDHHPTAEWLNKYKWATVTTTLDGEKTSGTELFYEYLCDNHILDVFSAWADNTMNFVQIVKKYDTWLWKEKYNDDTPKKWNDLLYIYGRERFIEKIREKLDNNTTMLDMTDITLLELNQEKIDRYINDKSKLVIEKEIQGYKAGIVFAEMYHSELGNTLAERNPQLDFIVLINPSTSISYRCVKNTVDLGKDIAAIYGGGGHPKAAGSPLPINLREAIIEMIFKG
jgi:oligoribonuclease NrnB/cAMP/cGMP phosphodiesterase (DHH superfamily)